MKDNVKRHEIISFDEIKKGKSKGKVSEHMEKIEKELELILDELIVEEENREV